MKKIIEYIHTSKEQGVEVKARPIQDQGHDFLSSRCPWGRGQSSRTPCLLHMSTTVNLPPCRAISRHHCWGSAETDDDTTALHLVLCFTAWRHSRVLSQVQSSLWRRRSNVDSAWETAE